MTDSAGLLQHASSTIPNFAEGYCTDDNARALLLTVLLEQLGQGSGQVQRLATTYAAFLNYAFDRAPGPVPQLPGLRPPVARGRRLGRQPRPCALALGACVGRSRRRDLQFWASQLFDLALPAIAETTSPRGWAFARARGLPLPPALLRGPAGQPDARRAGRPADRAVRRSPPTDDWCWFEEVLAYDNAKLPHALIAAGRSGGDPRALEVGPAGAAMAGRAAEGAQRLSPPDRLQRLLPPRGRARPVRPAAARGPCHRLRLPRGVPCHRGHRLAPGGPARVRVVPRRQRPGAGPLRRQDRRLLRRPPGGPRQPQPGGRVDALVPAFARRDEAVRDHAGHPPPGPGELTRRRPTASFTTYPSLDTEVRSHLPWKPTERR